MLSVTGSRCGIDIPASKVWDFFYRNKDRLTNERCLIAYDRKRGTEIFLMSSDGYPLIVVDKNYSTYFQCICASRSDCKASVQKLYDAHISNA